MSSWKPISTMAEHSRYKKQDGVNVISVFEQAADPQEVADILENIHGQFENPAQKNQIRFYQAKQKLNDSGGGISVFYGGKEVMHKPLVMGSLTPLVEIIQAALEKDAEKYQQMKDSL